jgi:hypothetical protein
MPVFFNELNSLPDILSGDRHKIIFPSLPGVNGDLLSKLYESSSLPTVGVGHTVVKLFGHSVAHAGSLEFDNQFSVNFHEIVTGGVSLSIYNWMKLVRDSDSGVSVSKLNYAVDMPVFIYDTTGKAALTYTLLNAYPIAKEPAELGETPGPYAFTVQFSCDGLDLKNAY